MKTTKIKKVKFGELEDKVMQCIWELSNNGREELVDVKSIINNLNNLRPEKLYVYTTIHTTCLRLCKKKKLNKIQIKNKYFYKPNESKELAFKNELQMLANKYYNGDLEKTIAQAQTLKV